MGHRIIKIKKFFQIRVFWIDFTIRKNVFVKKNFKKLLKDAFYWVFQGQNWIFKSRNF